MRLTGEKREIAQINNIINERGQITTEPPKMQDIMRIYYKCPYSVMIEDLEKWTTFRNI